MLARVAPDARRSRTASIGTTLSRDPSVAAKAVDDPLLRKTSTARFAAEAFAEQERVRARCRGGFGMPTLVLHGEDDRLVPTDGVGGPRRRCRTSSGGPSRGSATSSTTSPRGRRSSTTIIAWLPAMRCYDAAIGRQPNQLRLRGALTR